MVTSETKSKKPRAILITSIVSVFLIVPTAYLAWTTFQYHRRDQHILPATTAFAYPYADGKGALTHTDLQRQVTVIATLVNCALGCVAELGTLSELKTWADQALKPKYKDGEAPSRPLAFVIMHTHQPIVAPAGWRSIVLTENEARLEPTIDPLPPTANTLSIVDYDGYFRSQMPLNASLDVDATKRMLSRLAISQNLFDYVSRQTLMWEKAKGRAH